MIKAYVDYVTSTIRGKELFHSIDMKMTQSWDFLLWCDPSNYGGIRCLTPKDDDTEKTNPLEEGDFTFFFLDNSVLHHFYLSNFSLLFSLFLG